MPKLSPSDDFTSQVQDAEVDQLVRPPANPAAPPPAVTNTLYDMGVRPFADMAHGLSDLATGQGVTPAVGEGVMSALGMLSPTGAIFAGPMARTANHAMLRKAQSMAEAGAAPRGILMETGWFRGTDGKWRFEISDHASRVPDTARRNTARPDQVLPDPTRHGQLSDFFDHPDLYAAYPDLARMPLGALLGKVSERGAHIPATEQQPSGMIRMASMPPSEARSVLSHEVSHAIQDVEDFAPGGNPADIAALIPKEMAARMSPSTVQQAGYEGYRRMAGEVEARNVQTRLDMTPERRRSIMPSTTQDVPDKDQFLPKRFMELKQRGHLIPIDHDPFATGAIAGAISAPLVAAGSSTAEARANTEGAWSQLNQSQTMKDFIEAQRNTREWYPPGLFAPEAPRLSPGNEYRIDPSMRGTPDRRGYRWLRNTELLPVEHDPFATP